MRRAVVALALLGTVALPTAAADPPYLGRWKLNVSKSDVGSVSMIIADAGEGRIRLVSGIIGNGTFKIDGQEHQAPPERWSPGPKLTIVLACGWDSQPPPQFHGRHESHSRSAYGCGRSAGRLGLSR